MKRTVHQLAKILDFCCNEGFDSGPLASDCVEFVGQVVHRHAPLAEVEREWEVGRRLDHLADADGNLPVCFAFRRSCLDLLR